MKVMTFAASNSRKSINKKLVKFAASKLTNADIDYVDINDFDLPIYNIDLEQEYGIPNGAHAFLKHIKKADTILISFAEHNGNFTAAFKNLFDWLSRIDTKVYQGKKVIMLSTSPGAGGGSSVLNLAKKGAPFFDGEVVGALSIPSFYDNFDSENNQLTDPILLRKLEETLSVFNDEMILEKSSVN